MACGRSGDWEVVMLCRRRRKGTELMFIFRFSLTLTRIEDRVASSIQRPLARSPNQQQVAYA